ncbi:cytochrome C [Bizionia argentinensis JUB59]|uniref:Cytochrome C n=1 Tax=Bizionia argentinensis JUB59 TaxID=1046627 RepID=G2EC06_9FLAO|nr:heme-binding domain-containing protein [Bizionia argentinensis]EGV44036.1 cytochrome C [Bizionia argentinensis JUB59]
MKIIKKVILLLLFVFIIAQFFRPEKNEGDLTSVEPFLLNTLATEEVSVILKESCFDCHSNYTRYPWYNNITPLNYWLAEHVNDGKKHFNISLWSDHSVKKKDHKLEELIEMVETKEMPLDSYLWTHSEASLTDEQRISVVNWAKQMRIIYGLAPRPQ